MADIRASRSTPRLAPLRYEELDAAQRLLWDSIRNSARGADARVVTQDHLGGPFDPWLRSPEMGLRAAQLGEVLRFGSKLDPLVRETAIMAAGAHFHSEFEFWIHSQIAIAEGMTPDTVEEIAKGQVDPQRSGALVAITNHIAREMLLQGNLTDAIYAEASELLGHDGLMEVVSLVGYYTLVSLTLNVFRVPLPDGVTARWSTESAARSVHGDSR
jgi:4-carboxymuconolactone decarboxylase